MRGIPKVIDAFLTDIPLVIASKASSSCLDVYCFDFPRGGILYICSYWNERGILHFLVLLKIICFTLSVKTVFENYIWRKKIGNKLF